MQNTQNTQNTSNLSGADIIKYLNSGQYIPLSIRNTLEDKLDIERKTGKITVLDEFFARIAGNCPQSNQQSQKNSNVRANQNKSTEAYPMLSQDKANKPKISCADKPQLDFQKLTKITNKEEATIRSIFVDTEIQLNFDDIRELYDTLYLYRIRLCYMNLGRKIHILDAIHLSGNILSTEIKNQLGYDGLKLEYQKYGLCLQIYLNLQDIVTFLTTLIDLHFFVKINIDSSTCMFQLRNELNKLNINGIDFSQNFMDTYAPYSEAYNIVIDFIKLDMELLNSCIENPNRVSKELFDVTPIKTMIENVILFSEKILKESDPNISCDYYIDILNNNDRFNIYGVSDYHYVTYLTNFDLNYETDELYDDVLITMNLHDVEMMFGEKYSSEIGAETYFININMSQNLNMGNMYIHCQFPELPTGCQTIKIMNLPPNCTTVTSQLNAQVKNIPDPIVNKYTQTTCGKWLRKSNTNPVFSISLDDMSKLDEELAESYTLEETNQNSFYVDYVFNELLSKDNTGLIDRKMLASFYTLAKETSL